MKKSRKYILLPVISLLIVHTVSGQYNEDDDEPKKGFRKENLFTGGTISLAFYSNTFLVGANPVFGYSVTKWADAGLVINYTYSSQRDVSYWGSDDKLRQTIYGGGIFAKLYPVRFLFVQAQLEHNNIRQKYIYPGGGLSDIIKVDASSFLIGGGYTSGRDPEFKQPFFYLAVLFDIADNAYSPYTDNLGRVIPIVRGGIQIPLFQKK